jgi:hypothetical protein
VGPGTLPDHLTERRKQIDRSWGGTQNSICNYNFGYGVGCGTVFKLTPSTTGWSFPLSTASAEPGRS